ncbi:thioredoxin domain-containing protein [Bacteroides fragilis]|jgi:glutaredoxin|uniref:Thioredoxin domain-containing protein n=2 Tax=Bacteroides fragilis TaxID=817 RepID=A0A413JPJ1_BACFG|nr:MULTISPECIES: thioredoxin domain-containing protein [Bacteroides]MBU3043692.1 DsbA family protein [Bacteroides sp. HF-4919]MCE8635389.1 DsbA family protein [Bacteroides fragilis]MCE8681887.1 DsbA family protein [Bacteroides fragilis]MCM0222940.1 thioredoxin domain-containing protein [Bacteroides fragilis]MCM0360568.1 thioredoxin domain-containing protein [Bacteroides fragilis]
MKIYDDWFEKNKYKSKEVFEKAEFELNATDINAETEEHKKWKTENHLTATPTILINGYQLSDKYKIEDLVSFTDIDIH